MKCKTASGFTLLEAVVALVILSTSGMALYGWLNTSLSGLNRVQDTVELRQVMEELDSYFATLNIQAEVQRDMRVNEYDISWQAILVEPGQPGRSGAGTLGRYELGLYDVAVQVYKGQRAVGEYRTRLVGYRRVR